MKTYLKQYFNLNLQMMVYIFYIVGAYRSAVFIMNKPVVLIPILFISIILPFYKKCLKKEQE